MLKNLLGKTVLNPSKILKGSNLRKDMPEEFVVASKHWSLVVSVIEKHLVTLQKEGGDMDEFLKAIRDFDDIHGVFQKSCWSWSPNGKTVRFADTDRMGQHFFGAMYTNEEYEWPRHEDWYFGGCPLLPFFQLSLDHASEVAGTYIGSGLLQLFDTSAYDFSEGYFLRHIPREKIDLDLMTPIPTFGAEQARNFEETYVWEVEDVFGDSSECIHIDGYTEKKFSTSSESGLILALKHSLETSGVKSLRTAVRHLEAIGQHLEKLHEEIGDERFDLALFGYVEPIQCFAREMPDPLIRLGGCRGLITNWCDDNKFDVYGDGNGQVYFKAKSKGNISYEFYGDR